MENELEQVKKLVDESKDRGVVIARGYTNDNKPMMMIRIDKDSSVIQIVDNGGCVSFDASLDINDKVCLKKHSADSFEWVVFQ